MVRLLRTVVVPYAGTYHVMVGVSSRKEGQTFVLPPSPLHSKSLIYVSVTKKLRPEDCFYWSVALLFHTYNTTQYNRGLLLPPSLLFIFAPSNPFTTIDRTILLLQNGSTIIPEKADKNSLPTTLVGLTPSPLIRLQRWSSLPFETDY